MATSKRGGRRQERAARRASAKAAKRRSRFSAFGPDRPRFIHAAPGEYRPFPRVKSKASPGSGEIPFAEWSPDREHSLPFVDPDAMCGRQEVVPQLTPGSPPQKPWIIEEDGTIKASWGAVVPLANAPANVKAAAERCRVGSPWKKVRDRLREVRATVELPPSDCRARFNSLQEYSYLDSAFRTATGRDPFDDDRYRESGAYRFPTGLVEAEKDFIKSCVRAPVTGSRSRQRELEFEGPALDMRARERDRILNLRSRAEHEVISTTSSNFPTTRGLPACRNLVRDALETASASGAYSAETAGPLGTLETFVPYESVAATACLRPEIIPPSAYSDDWAARVRELEYDVDPATRRKNVARHREQFPDEDYDDTYVIPDEPAPRRRSAFPTNLPAGANAAEVERLYQDLRRRDPSGSETFQRGLAIRREREARLSREQVRREETETQARQGSESFRTALDTVESGRRERASNVDDNDDDEGYRPSRWADEGEVRGARGRAKKRKRKSR